VCLLGLLLAALTLAACGGASSTAGSSSAKASALSAAPAAPTATSKPGTAAKGTTAHTGKPAQGAAGSGSAAQTQFKQALSSFAACLRGNGVKLPSAGGPAAAPTLSLKGVDTRSPGYRSALAKCRPVLSAALKSVSKTRPAPATPAAKPTAGTGSPGTAGNSPPIAVKVPASVTTVMQRFTACMRSNGITGFPEPKGASFVLTGTSVDPNTATYKEAQTKCNPILQAMVPKG